VSRRIKIAPSILSADFGHLAEAIQHAEAGGADWIHVDVMDGLFVPNISYGFPIVEAVRQSTNLPIDVHLREIGVNREVEINRACQRNLSVYASLEYILNGCVLFEVLQPTSQSIRNERYIHSRCGRSFVPNQKARVRK